MFHPLALVSLHSAIFVFHHTFWFLVGIRQTNVDIFTVHPCVMRSRRRLRYLCMNILFDFLIRDTSPPRVQNFPWRGRKRRKWSNIVRSLPLTCNKNFKGKISYADKLVKSFREHLWMLRYMDEVKLDWAIFICS